MRKHLVLFILIILICPILTAADLHSADFDLIFEKPPFNECFFSDSTDTSKRFSAQYGILTFPTVNEKQSRDGYPSTAYVGVTYKFESKGVFNVYFSANFDLANLSSARMLHTDNTTGLDMQISIFADNASATENTDALVTHAKDADASAPIYTKNVTAKMDARESRIIRMQITSPQKANGSYDRYKQGEYTGYLIMHFQPTA